MLAVSTQSVRCAVNLWALAQPCRRTQPQSVHCNGSACFLCPSCPAAFTSKCTLGLHECHLHSKLDRYELLMGSTAQHPRPAVDQQGRILVRGHQVCWSRAAQQLKALNAPSLLLMTLCPIISSTACAARTAHWRHAWQWPITRCMSRACSQTEENAFATSAETDSLCEC
jgi:hypothetical protein